MNLKTFEMKQLQQETELEVLNIVHSQQMALLVFLLFAQLPLLVGMTFLEQVAQQFKYLLILFLIVEVFL